MGDLVWVRNFFRKPLEKEFFSPTHNSKIFFFQYFTARDISFQCRILFSSDIPLQGFFIYPLEISLQSIFSEITHTHLESQMVDP